MSWKLVFSYSCRSPSLYIIFKEIIFSSTSLFMLQIIFYIYPLYAGFNWTIHFLMTFHKAVTFLLAESRLLRFAVWVKNNCKRNSSLESLPNSFSKKTLSRLYSNISKLSTFWKMFITTDSLGRRSGEVFPVQYTHTFFWLSIHAFHFLKHYNVLKTERHE